jgi:hypothetical protein
VNPFHASFKLQIFYYNVHTPIITKGKDFRYKPAMAVGVPGV